MAVIAVAIAVLFLALSAYVDMRAAKAQRAHVAQLEARIVVLEANNELIVKALGTHLELINLVSDKAPRKLHLVPAPTGKPS